MSRVCEYCGKRTRSGGQMTRRGKAKYLGGIGIKTTSHTKRTFKPNIQKVRADVNGTVKRVKICARCLRSGKVKKPRVGGAPEPQAK